MMRAFLCFILLFQFSLARAQLDTQTQAQKPVPDLYHASYALVVGIDEYSGGWPPLRNAVTDARQVATALESAGYQTELALNLTSQQLKQQLRNFFVAKGAEKNARLLLWFAGHGQTLDGEGFLVPADAPSSEDSDFKFKAVHMREFGSLLRLANSKHILAVFDACFAGTIFDRTRAGPSQFVRAALDYPTRQFITSGDEAQVVLDNGTFRELFVEALTGNAQADLNRDGYLTASEIGFFLTERVTNLTDATQTPRYGKLADKKFERGEFVLVTLPQARELLGESRDIQAVRTENLLWESALSLNTEVGFNLYLERFPNGQYARLASLMIDRLTKQPTDTDADSDTGPKLPASTEQHKSSSRSVAAEPAQIQPDQPPPRPSMEALMAAARAKRAEQSSGESEDRCIQRCDSRYYYQIIDAKEDEAARNACEVGAMDRLKTDQCYQQKLSHWVKKERSRCRARC